jgi:hypothetical protein
VRPLPRCDSAASYSVHVNLDDYAYEMLPYTIQTPLLGEVTLTGMGYGYVQIASKGVTGYPNIASFQSKGYLTGPFTGSGPGGTSILPFTYRITMTDDSSIAGTITYQGPGSA